MEAVGSFRRESAADGMAMEQAGDTFSEDCLTLNVWTKPQVGEEKKAVMIWIVGGGWTTGATNNVYGDDGEHIVDQEDVIVVSMKYVATSSIFTCWC